MSYDEVMKKLQAEQASYGQTQQSIGACPQTPIGGDCYRPSPTQEAERRAERSADEANKAYQAADFLRRHPEFDEFIQLIRKGAIGI